MAKASEYKSRPLVFNSLTSRLRRKTTNLHTVKISAIIEDEEAIMGTWRNRPIEGERGSSGRFYGGTRMEARPCKATMRVKASIWAEAAARAKA